MRRIAALFTILFTTLFPLVTLHGEEITGDVEISTEDIPRFWAAYDLAKTAPDRAAVFQFLVFFSMPAFFLGGYTWPSENMSLFAKLLSSLLPTTPLLNVFTRLTVLEGAVPFIGRFWLHQALLAVAYLLLGTLALKLRSRRYPKAPQAEE